MRGRGTLDDWARGLIRPVFYLGNNRLSQLGVVLTTTSAITIVTFYTTEFFGVHVSPYAGIAFFLILPGFFVLGLLLIPPPLPVRSRGERVPWPRRPALSPPATPDPKLRET